MAAELGRVIDELGVERKHARDLRDIELAETLAVHWQTSLDQLAVLIEQWPIVLGSIGCIELTERRNRLLARQHRPGGISRPQGWSSPRALPAPRPPSPICSRRSHRFPVVRSCCPASISAAATTNGT